MTGPMREDVERLAAAFRRATFSKGRTVGGICGQTIDAMMASTMHEVSALTLEEGAFALETLAAENAALQHSVESLFALIARMDSNSKTHGQQAARVAQATGAMAAVMQTLQGSSVQVRETAEQLSQLSDSFRVSSDRQRPLATPVPPVTPASRPRQASAVAVR